MFDFLQKFACKQKTIRKNQRATLKSIITTTNQNGGGNKRLSRLQNVKMLTKSVCSSKVVRDISNASYKNKTAQESAWMRIASDCGLEGKALCAKAVLTRPYRRTRKS